VWRDALAWSSAQPLYSPHCECDLQVLHDRFPMATYPAFRLREAVCDLLGVWHVPHATLYTRSSSL
jgi:hypothetical protein